MGDLKLITLQFIISFVFVFFKGFQHQNVIGGKYTQAFVVSYLMAIMAVWDVTLIIDRGIWESVLPVGTGASFGIVSSMYLYRLTEDKGILFYISKLLRIKRE